MTGPDTLSLAEICENAAERAGAGVGEVDCAVAVRAQREGDILLLDCRRADELQSVGLIPGAIHVVLDEIHSLAEEALFPGGATPEQKQTPILCYCRSGVRSLSAVKALQAQGFTTCVSMAGGILGWQSAGGPIDRL
jgi:rhodanese-related sulfurtransferase